MNNIFSENEDARFMAQHRQFWKKLGELEGIHSPRLLSLKRASTRWWWTQSEAEFELFKNDYYAQGYELLRRLPKYRQQLFFYNNPEKTWCQLHLGTQVLFESQYRRNLVRMGLAKQIFFSPRGIDFDCRLPARYLIEALKDELRKPTPLIAGTNGQSMIPKPVSVKEHPVTAYTKQCGTWQIAFAPQPYMIHLPLPKDTLTGDRILSFFTTFVKDNPPQDFTKHRAECRQKLRCERARRKPFIKPAKLALALMTLDFGDIAKLSRWLMKNSSVPRNLGIEGTQQKIAKRLYNARQRLRKLPS